METTLPDRLLSHLRLKLGATISFDPPPVELSGGYDTTTMAFGLLGAPPGWTGGLILRVMRFADTAMRVRREAATHAALVVAGFPAPRILLVETDAEVLGKPFLIMERLAGDTMWASAMGRLKPFLAMSRQLAEIHALLHRIRGEALLAQARAFGVDLTPLTLKGEVRRLQSRIEDAGVAGLLPGVAWLAQNLPQHAEPEVICHGDFHPLNIMMDGDRLSGVIDWPQAIVAEPAYDVAASRVIARFARLSPSPWRRAPSSVVRDLMVRQYMRTYRAIRLLPERNIAYFEAMRVLSALTFAAERRGPGNPWGTPHTSAALYRHFERITGMQVRI